MDNKSVINTFIPEPAMVVIWWGDLEMDSQGDELWKIGIERKSKSGVFVREANVTVEMLEYVFFTFHFSY